MKNKAAWTKWQDKLHVRAMWILARDKQLPADIRAQLLAKAQALGIAVDQLVWVDQSRSDS
nr:lipocalin family protein [uncultured Albidiferax sp.]